MDVFLFSLKAITELGDVEGSAGDRPEPCIRYLYVVGSHIYCSYWLCATEGEDAWQRVATSSWHLAVSRWDVAHHYHKPRLHTGEGKLGKLSSRLQQNSHKNCMWTLVFSFLEKQCHNIKWVFITTHIHMCTYNPDMLQWAHCVTFMGLIQRLCFQETS